VRLCKSIARVCGVEVHDPLALPQETSKCEGASGLPEELKLIQALGLGSRSCRGVMGAVGYRTLIAQG